MKTVRQLQQLIETRNEKGLSSALKQLVELTRQSTDTTPKEYQRTRYFFSTPPRIVKSEPLLQIREFENPDPDSSDLAEGLYKDSSQKLLSMSAPGPQQFFNAGDTSLSHLSLALLSEEQTQDWAQRENLTTIDKAALTQLKQNIDHFYGQCLILPVSVNRLSADAPPETLYAISPTLPRFASQVLLISATGLEDVYQLIDSQRTLTTKQTLEAALELATTFSKKLKPAKRNSTDIELITTLLDSLSPGDILAQNALDTSSIPEHFHLQYLKQNDSAVFPIFQASASSESVSYSKTGDKIRFGKLDNYPGAVYRITTATNTDSVKSVITDTVNQFLQSKLNQGSTITSITRKCEERYEYYFTIKKSLANFNKMNKGAKRVVLHPGNKRKRIPEIRPSNAGWEECCGVVATPFAEAVASHFTEEKQSTLLNSWAAKPDQCHFFECCFYQSLAKNLGDHSSNWKEYSENLACGKTAREAVLESVLHLAYFHSVAQFLIRDCLHSPQYSEDMTLRLSYALLTLDKGLLQNCQQHDNDTFKKLLTEALITLPAEIYTNDERFYGSLITQYGLDSSVISESKVQPYQYTL